MKKIFVVCFVLMILQTSQALRCKKCKDDKCLNLEDETCGVTAEARGVACLVHVYKDANKTEITEKKCVNFHQGGKYECEKSKGEVVRCSTCEEDLCNKAEKIGDGVYMMMLGLFVGLKVI